MIPRLKYGGISLLRKFTEVGPALFMNKPNSFSFKILFKQKEIREVQEVQSCSEVFWRKKKGKNYLKQITGDHVSAISQSTFRIIYAFVDSTKKVFITLNKMIEWTIPARYCEMILFFYQASPRDSNMSKTPTKRVNRDAEDIPA